MIFQGILDLQIPSFSIIFHHFSLSFSSHILFDPAKERDRFNEAMASNADLTKNLDPDRHGDPHGGSTRMTQTRPPDVFQRSTWCTGIFPRSQIIVIGLKNKRIYRYYPLIFFVLCTSDPVFIDGSAFANKWQPLRTAASAFWSASHEWNAVLPGCDQSSQRAEIYALLYCLAFFRGDLTVYTDCMNVLNGFNRLVGCHFSPSVLGQLDNADLWEKMGQVLAQRQGTISLRKVKAHVSNHAQQCQYLTEGNSRADALAKSCAKEKLRVKISCFRDLISQAVGLQVHLVTTLMSRTEHFAHDDLERFNSPRIRTATPCSCVPLRRVRSKISACIGACAFFRR